MRGRGTLQLALLVLVLVSCAPSEEAAEVVTLDRGWEYRWGESPSDPGGSPAWLDPRSTGWQELPTLELPPREGDAEILWMRTRLPSHPAVDPTLLLPVVVGILDLYVDGALVKRGEGDAHAWQPVHLVRLPPGGRDLVLRVRTVSWVAGVLGTVRLASGEALLRDMVVRDLLRIAVVSILVVSGLLGLVAMRLAPARRMTGYFAVYALGSAGYTLFYTPVAQVLAPGFPFWVDVWGLSISLMPIGVLGLLETLYGRGSRDPIRLLLIGHVALLAAQFFSAYGFGPRATLLWDAPWGPSLTLAIAAAIRVGVVLTVLIGVPRLASVARTPGSDARLFLGGVLAVAAAALWDIWASFGLESEGWTSPMPFATAALLLALALVVARRYVQLLASYRHEIDLYEQERGRLLRDLHDGIGGITTNIRLLSDMERARNDSGPASDTLQTISQLSAEGLAQIRGYTQSLEEPTSWDQLAAELRRAATQVLEPHGFALAFERVVEEGTPAPRAPVCMALWRVYREMLTNVAKYGAAGEVRVDLVVADDRLRLTVENACASQPRERGVGQGRGLANMRGRALELGGCLEASFEGPARVSLSLPITSGSPGQGMVAEPPRW